MINASLAAAGSEMFAVDRAAGELRRGNFVVIEGVDDAALIQAAETATAESLATMASLTGSVTSLALTARRARVLDLDDHRSAVISLPLGTSIDVATIRGLADPTYANGHALSRSIALHQCAGDDNAVAAIRLSKLAQLLPAALTAPLPHGRLTDLAGAPNLSHVGVGAIADYVTLTAETLRPVGEARVPLAGAEDARVVGFRSVAGGSEHYAIVIGDPAAQQPVLCRLHGECFTGDLLGSLRCDCGPQLQKALQVMGEVGHGVLLYLAHEGRGIGLINKLRAYQLQDRGLDTVEANHHLGFEPDERSYRAAAVMLRQLGVHRVRLLTNNPTKLDALNAEGIEVVERLPLSLPANRHNLAYLETKARRAGHLL